MSIRWVVFGEVVVGEVEAQNRDHAEIAAGRAWPGFVRVQSRASYEISRLEGPRAPLGDPLHEWSHEFDLSEDDGA